MSMLDRLLALLPHERREWRTSPSRRRFLQGMLCAAPAVALAGPAAALIEELLTPPKLITYGGVPIEFDGIAEIVRRAFVPKLVVQMYSTSPVMAALLANAERRQAQVFDLKPTAAKLFKFDEPELVRVSR